jgi:hypothetical protein
MPKRKKPVKVITDNKCDYGCGNKANYISSSGKYICESHNSKCTSLKKKNSEAIKMAHKEGRIPGWNDIENLNRGWSKGLTKDTDARVLKAAKSLKKRFENGELSNSRPHTEETKRIMSEKRTLYLENSPHIKWKILSNGIKVQGLWEYNVGEKLLKLGYDVSRNKIFYDSHRRYTPDFCIDENLYIEVKGWLSDRDIVKYTKVFKDNPNIKIYLIRDELDKNNYTRFISGEIFLEECEDLKEVLGC